MDDSHAHHRVGGIIVTIGGGLTLVNVALGLVVMVLGLVIVWVGVRKGRSERLAERAT